MPEQLAAMPPNAEELNSKIERAVAEGQLMESAAKNIRVLLAGTSSDFYSRVVDELVATAKWSELNDRFYQTLVFGTGGLRGRTIDGMVRARNRRLDPFDLAHGRLVSPYQQ